MNLNPEFASMWKGRVLIKVDHEPTDKPQVKVQDILEKEVKVNAMTND